MSWEEVNEVPVLQGRGNLKTSGRGRRKGGERSWPSAMVLMTLLFGLGSPLWAAADCTPASGGIISWWPGDGNAADIVFTNSGALQGGATASAPGMVGQAFAF